MHSVCVPLKWGVIVCAEHMQLPPRRTSPTKLPAVNGFPDAGAAPKNVGCGSSKASGMEMSCPCAPTRQRWPPISTVNGEGDAAVICASSRESALVRDCPAGLAGAPLHRVVEVLQDRRQLLLDIGDVQI